jgi:hypothetical protein
MLYPTRSLSWIYHAFHSLLSVIESRNTVSIRTRHNTATNWEILSNAPPLVGGCFAIMNQPKIVCLVPEDLTRPRPTDNYDLSLYLQRRRRGIVS